MQSARAKSARVAGFTLIELSIVLVIIGLIVGGVLVGQDLIRAAYVRAQISQIEKYNTAVNTFRGKYNALPGDLNQATASTYGFAARGQYAGEGDGNGIIEGTYNDQANQNYGYVEYGGETAAFWVDLSSNVAGNLIDGGFKTASLTGDGSSASAPITGTVLGNWFPSAKLGNGNYIYVWSLGGINYYGLSAVTAIEVGGNGGDLDSDKNISVTTAYNIDKKVDDGFPYTGRVLTMYLTPARGTWTDGVGPSTPSNITPSSSTCIDTAGLWSSNPTYSTNYNSGAAGNCALSFKFQ